MSLQRRRPVAKGNVRALGVVVSAPLLHQVLRLQTRGEDFAVQQVVAQFPVEALDVSALPGTARFDGQGADFQSAQELPHRLRCHL